MNYLLSIRFSKAQIAFIPTGLYVLVLLMSCKAGSSHSTDFTPELGFTEGIEGPAVDKAGKLYAVNFKEQGTIGVVDEHGHGELLLKLPGKSIGNGIRFDREDNMYIADYVGHTVYKVKKGTKDPQVWAQNSAMSQPNDLAIAPNGTIYLSDPNWAAGTGRIWMVNGERKIVLMQDGMGTTNGIEVSPDGKILYVNESIQRTIWHFDIQLDGSLSNKTKFLSFEDFGMDGMRCDKKGNLYVTRYDKGTVAIISSDKKIIKEIQLTGKKPSNITFGGVNGKTCFVTMADRGCIESFRALHPGRFYAVTHK